MEALVWIEQLAPVEALKRAFVAYPLVNAGHVLSIGLLVTGILMMDLRILGRLAAFDATRFVSAMRRLAVAGFAGAVATGLPMFAIRATDYAANPAFRLKLVLIAMAAVNMMAFHVVMRGRLDATFPPAARVLAILSLMLWPAVLLSGRFIGFV